MAGRNIKFQYFVGIKQEQQGKDVWSVKGKFDIEEWINKLDTKNLLMNTIELQNTMARVERTHFHEAAEVWILKFYKLRDDNIPSIVEENIEAKEIPLKENEYIGEDLYMLYDNVLGVGMVQVNRFSLGLKNLEELLTNIWGIEGERIRLKALLNLPDGKNFHGKSYRMLEVNFANIDNRLSRSGNSLGQIMNSFRKFGGVSGTVKISLGRTRQKTLNRGEVEQFITDVMDEASVVGCKMRVRDDDQSPVQVIDLFDNVLSDVIEFKIEKKSIIQFETAEMLMVRSYRERKEQIGGLLEQRS